jgi:hypothetical protein
MKTHFYSILSFVLILMSPDLMSQGCSDAGVCTMSGLAPHSDSIAVDNPVHSLRIGASYGNADNAIVVLGNYLEFSSQLTPINRLSLRLTSLAQSGNDISVAGLSDLYINGQFRLEEDLSLSIGFKIPMMNGGRSLDGLPLPMDYQASLGTYDLLLGMHYRINRWQLVAALQQPLIQNKNEFDPMLYPEGSALRAFQNTNQFIRRPDVLIRVSYAYPVGDQFILTPSILPIYHLGEDSYLDQNEIERKIEGSDGLTFNMNLYADYKFGEHQKLQFNVGFPLVVREARPDGLTRSMVATLEYRVDF